MGCNSYSPNPQFASFIPNNFQPGSRMVKVCCVKGCSSKQQSSLKCPWSFHGFPTDPTWKAKWISAIPNSEHWSPTVNSRICSVHFKSEDFNLTYASGIRKLRENVVPSVFPSRPSEVQALSFSRESSPSSSDCEVFDNAIPTVLPEIQSENSPICRASHSNSSSISGEEIEMRFEEEILEDEDESTITHFMAETSSTTSTFPSDETPRMVLINKLAKTTAKLVFTRKKVKTLQRQNQRLKMQLNSMKDIIGQLKKNKTSVMCFPWDNE